MNNLPPKPHETYNVPPRILVKFRDSVELAGKAISVSELLKQDSGGAGSNTKHIELTPDFEDAKATEFSERIRSAADRRRDLAGLNLRNFRSAEVQTDTQGLQLAEDLQKRDDVEYAYLRPGLIMPPSVYADDGPQAGGQEHLGAAPVGIDARYAWTIAGGDGAKQRLADVEWGWDIHHSGLPTSKISQVNPGHYRDIPHGTNVLGVIAAVDNSAHCVGITPNIDSIVTVGQWRSPDEELTHQAVVDAILELNAGDVLLLETQTSIYDHSNIPLEAEPAVFQLIEIATHLLDIVVVEAAGNGGINLDAVQNDAGDFIFDRSMRDSGAIIVGSASPNSNPCWQRMNSSCFGSRVDCFAWGANVRTLSSNASGSDHDGWTEYFNRTSAATAIVAGCALSVQGAIEAQYGRRLSAQCIRVLLASPQLNTVSAYYGTDQIGVMPDLRSIINNFPQEGIAELMVFVTMEDFGREATETSSKN